MTKYHKPEPELVVWLNAHSHGWDERAWEGHPASDPETDMDPDLAKTLAEHSPRLIIEHPVLLRNVDSPTGWLLVEPASTPDKPEPPAEVWASYGPDGWKLCPPDAISHPGCTRFVAAMRVK